MILINMYMALLINLNTSNRCVLVIIIVSILYIHVPTQLLGPHEDEDGGWLMARDLNYAADLRRIVE